MSPRDLAERPDPGASLFDATLLRYDRGMNFDHSGSTFDSFLDEFGIREEVEALAQKRIWTWHAERDLETEESPSQQ